VLQKEGVEHGKGEAGLRTRAGDWQKTKGRFKGAMVAKSDSEPETESWGGVVPVKSPRTNCTGKGGSGCWCGNHTQGKRLGKFMGAR